MASASLGLARPLKFHGLMFLRVQLTLQEFSLEVGVQNRALIICQYNVSQKSKDVGCSNNIDNGALSNSCDKAGQFQGKPLEKILVFQIFAGTGRLSAALRDKGFTSMAIDKDPSRSKQVHIVQYDLVDEAQRNSSLQLIDKEGLSILWAHFAPSCGTASRSRERPLKKFEKMGFSIPKPLRSDAFPLGLPNLQGLDREKVIIANETYKAMIEVAE